MNQQKQKTLRILQTTKSSHRKPSFYFLLGLFSGVLITTLSAGLYLNYTDINITSNTGDSASSNPTQMDNEEASDIKLSTDDSNHLKKNEIDDQPYNKISDKELKGIFIQPKQPENQQQKSSPELGHSSNRTPFEKIQQAEMAPSQSPKAVLAQKIPSTTSTKASSEEKQTPQKVKSVTDQSNDKSDLKPKPIDTESTNRETSSSQRIYPASAVISM